MAQYAGTSCVTLKGKLKALVQLRPSTELRAPRQQPALPKEPATPDMLKGLRRRFSKFKQSLRSGFKSLASTAGGLTCCARPASEELELDLIVGATASEAAFESKFDARASLTCVSRASVMAGNSKKTLLHRIISAPISEQEQCLDEAVTSFQLMTADEIHAVKAQDVAECNEQVSQLQANHAAAESDAVDSQAASGADVYSATGTMELPSFHADLGTCDDMGSEQQQEICSKVPWSSNADRVHVDVGCVMDDGDC